MGSVHRLALSPQVAAAAVLVMLAGSVPGVAAGADDPSTGTPAATAPGTPAKPVTLTAPDNLTRNFGERRGPQTINVLIDADAALTSAPAVAVDDVQNSDGTLLDGTVSATADLVGGRSVRVPLVVDPADSAEAGTYAVKLRLRGPEITSTDVMVAVELERSPDGAGAWVLALAALTAGLAIGAAVKWFAERGTELRALVQRRTLLTATLADAGPVPRSLRRALQRVDLLLAQGNITLVTSELAGLEVGMRTLLPALDALAPARDAVTAQESRIPLMAAAPALEARLRGVISVERQQIQAAVDATWPTPDDATAGAAQRTALRSHVDGFTTFLDEYRTPGSRDGVSAEMFDKALSEYEAGKFTEAQGTWSPQIAGADDAETPDGAAGEPAIDLPGIGTMSKFRWWLVSHAPTALGLLTAASLAIIGLFTIFDPDTMFLSDDARDVLLLVLWGLGTSLTGVTAAQLAAKATAAIAPPA